MGGEQSRRGFLSAGAAVGFTPLLGRWSSWDSLPNTLEIESDGSGFAAYELTVSGSLRQQDSGDEVDGNWAYGTVGPKRGTDTFAYSGEITGLILAGPATVYRNGMRIRPSVFPHPTTTPTPGDFPVTSGTDVVRIESEGGGMAVYEMEVTGSLAQRDSGDQVSGRRVWGHVGPERGVDAFEFTGDLTRFALAGPARVSLNGTAITAESGGSKRGLVNVTPATVTARPNSTVLFEAVSPGHSGEYLHADWSVDGEWYVGPGAFYGHMNGPGRVGITEYFEEAGTHDVRLKVYEDEDGEKGPLVGKAHWTVEIGPDGNRAPSVQLGAPEEPISVAQHSPERRTFEVAVSDPEGALDRVVWWITQCDDVVAVSNVSGASDTASISFAPEWGCPLAVRAIDADGVVSGLRGWDVE